MKTIKALTAIISLISEVVYLGIAIVGLAVLLNFSRNFKTLLDLAGGM